MSVTTATSQQIPKMEETVVNVNESATGKPSLVIASLMLLTESMMGSSPGRKNPVPAKKKQVRRGPCDKDDTSDEEGRLSAEESTVAGSPLTGSPTLSCSAPSLDQDAEELSDVESERDEQAFQSLSLKVHVEVDEPQVDGFYMVGRRIAGIFAELDETSSEEDSDDLPHLEDVSDDEKIDVKQWQGIGKRLASLPWLDMEDSDLDN